MMLHRAVKDGKIAGSTSEMEPPGFGRSDTCNDSSTGRTCNSRVAISLDL